MKNARSCREPQKNNDIFLVAHKRGGAVRAWPLRNNTVFEALKQVLGNCLWPLSLRGVKGLGLSGQATEEKKFCGFPNSEQIARLCRKIDLC